MCIFLKDTKVYKIHKGERMKICFIAPSGYGKTTAVNYLTNKYGAVNTLVDGL